MITMKAIIENSRFGTFEWYAWLRTEPHPSAPEIKRGSRIGKLIGPRRLSLYGTQHAIKRTAKRMGAKLLAIELYTRAFKDDGSIDYRCTTYDTLWEAK